MDGSTVLGTVSINSQGIATYSVINQGLASASLSASFLPGNGNFLGSTSPTLTEGSTFTLAASPTSVSAAQAATSSAATLTLTPYFGMNGSITLSCNGLPSTAYCQFSPQSISFSGNTGSAAVVTVSVVTNNVARMKDREPPRVAPRAPISIACAALFVCCFLRRSRSSLRRSIRSLVCLIAVMIGLGCAVGCGNGTQVVASTGTYPFTVTASTQSGMTQRVSLTLIVTPDP